MKEVDKKKTSNVKQPKRTRGNDKRENNIRQENGRKGLNNKKAVPKASNDQPDSAVVSESNVGKEPSEVYGTMVVHYVDDANRSEEASNDSNTSPVAEKEKYNEVLEGHSSDSEVDNNQGTEVSDSETIKDSVSSVGDSPRAEDEKFRKCSKVPESTANKISSTNPLARSRVKKSLLKAVDSKAATISNKEKSRSSATKSANINTKSKEFPPKPSSESSEGLDDKLVEEAKEVGIMDEVSNGAQSVGSDRETFDGEENGAHEDVIRLENKVEDMERRIEKLEDELRVVAALEVALYSVVPEHGSSANKVHTPARRLSRLYIHACKFWTQDKRAIIAKNTISGIVLISKSCGNDVPRLTFWLSNTIVLREIISQIFGGSQKSNSLTKLRESSTSSKINAGKSANLKWKQSSGNREMNGLMQFIDDWQETGTFTAALEKVQSWIFSRIVESVWWQAITPHMQSPAQLTSSKSLEKVMGPALGDQKQNNFSVDLWKNAFHDALQRLCPVQAAGHECGCLPVLARMVMEHCISRLDVAMFNAILRESAHEIPTDPVSDPIVDCKVLPIPAGDLSFGSGAQLKNAVGNWSRSLTDMFGIDADDSLNEERNGDEDYDIWGGDGGPKCFPLLNSLSDLLMLPKDMLMDQSVRHEVCPLISLPLVKRVLCNFSPDEFCPDPVPGSVLETLNAESTRGSTRSFPYTATSVIYFPPSSGQIGKKVAESGGRSQLTQNVSAGERKGYTSDEELEELEFPLISVLDRLPASPTVITFGNGHTKEQHASHAGINTRYGLLNEVWSAI